jgi:hypothetical protein
MDPKEAASGAFIAALASGGKKIDSRVAQRVAEMLMSRDPKVLSKGVSLVAGNGRLMSALRSADNRIATALGEQGNSVPLLQVAGVGRADDKPNVPRPPGK